MVEINMIEKGPHSKFLEGHDHLFHDEEKLLEIEYEHKSNGKQYLKDLI